MSITGESWASWEGDQGTFPLHLCTGGTDFVVLKLDSNGIYHWHTFYGSEDNDGDASGEGTGISVIENGDILITGYSSPTWEGENGVGPLHPHSGDHDIVIFDLRTSGSYQWHTFYGSIERDQGFDIARLRQQHQYNWILPWKLVGRQQ